MTTGINFDSGQNTAINLRSTKDNPGLKDSMKEFSDERSKMTKDRHDAAAAAFAAAGAKSAGATGGGRGGGGEGEEGEGEEEEGECVCVWFIGT
jgi:hypothetical protein